MMHDFLNPEYFHAVGTAIMYGFGVLAGMLVAGTAFTVLSGGTAALKWKKSEGH